MHVVDRWVWTLGNNVFNYLQKRGFILLKDISDCIDDAVLYKIILEVVKLCSNLVRRYSCDMFEYVPVNLWNWGWVISDVICGGFAFVDLGVGGVVLGVVVVGTESDVVCASMVSTSPMMVIPSSVRYWRFNRGNVVSVIWLLTNAVAYVWAVLGGMPALQKKLNQSSFTHSTMFKMQVGWINTMTNKIQATKASQLLLYKCTNAKMNKNKILLIQQHTHTYSIEGLRPPPNFG